MPLAFGPPQPRVLLYDYPAMAAPLRASGLHVITTCHYHSAVFRLLADPPLHGLIVRLPYRDALDHFDTPQHTFVQQCLRNQPWITDIPDRAFMLPILGLYEDDWTDCWLLARNVLRNDTRHQRPDWIWQRRRDDFYRGMNRLFQLYTARTL